MNLNPIAGVAEAVIGGLDSLFTSDDERAAAELRVQKALQQPHLLQAMANIEEAKHKSIFVAGWRPCLGWVSAIGIGWTFVFQPFVALIVALNPDWGITPESLPTLDSGELMTLVMALLGLGGMRSYEKHKGVAR